MMAPQPKCLLSLCFSLMILSHLTEAFVFPQRSKTAAATTTRRNDLRSSPRVVVPITTTTLFQFNNNRNPLLPPPPPQDDWNALGSTVLTAALTVAFFLSPLGGFVLSLFNSLLLLAIFLPLAGAVAFQAWQTFNTVEGPCPVCGAPTRVLKDTPSVCFACGTTIQATPDKKGVERVSDVILEDQGLGGTSIFDTLFGVDPSTVANEEFQSPTTRRTKQQQDSDSKRIIDVDIAD